MSHPTKLDLAAVAKAEHSSIHPKQSWALPQYQRWSIIFLIYCGNTFALYEYWHRKYLVLLQTKPLDHLILIWYWQERWGWIWVSQGAVYKTDCSGCVCVCVCVRSVLLQDFTCRVEWAIWEPCLQGLYYSNKSRLRVPINHTLTIRKKSRKTKGKTAKKYHLATLPPSFFTSSKLNSPP